MHRFCFAVLFSFVLATSLIAEDRPNVLFIICDDLNCDLGTYDHPMVQSPNIDALAQRGVQFDNAHCQFALCGPSRASFMTSLYPDQTMILSNSIYLRQTLPNVISMSQHFREHHYFATRIGKIYHYGVPRNIGTGGHDDPHSWDHTINPIGRDKFEEAKVITLSPGRYGGTLSWLAADGTDEEQTDGIIVTEAIERLQWHAEQEDAFYLAVGLFRPHTPYVAPKKYFDLYPLDEIVIPEVPENYAETIPAAALKSVTLKKEKTELTPELAREVIQSYYASITFADAQIGRLLDALEETGLVENTIVLFTSDHGYHMGEHGQYQKTTLYENATRVPLIISAPGQKLRDHRTSAPVEMTDFYPTLAELAGLPVPTHVEGVSLVSALNDPAARPREGALTQLTVRSKGYSLKTERYRITEWQEPDGSQSVELYDHKSDSDEMKNLAGQPETASQQQLLLERLRERVAQAQVLPEGIQRVEDFKLVRTPPWDYQRPPK
ncbi:MAG: sulfatase [Verrucomicrobiota bacterium]